jgi:hypothetical protein
MVVVVVMLPSRSISSFLYLVANKGNVTDYLFC